MNEKIDLRHLEGLACVYVRQSSMSQVRNHRESRRRQIGLGGIAEQLGWPRHRVRIIDEDQGKSGTNTADRPGYQELLGLVAGARAGIILAVEVSRLARDDVAWQQMVRHCVFADVLMADETHVYDPKDEQDRMMLGMLGTLAEYELGTLRKRMQKSYREKAGRGELYGACPPGYVVQCEQLVKTPDARVRHVLDTVFAQFDRMPSVGALSRWCSDHDVEVPVSLSPRGGEVSWCPPTTQRLLRVLHNPCYAGAYVFGRRPTIKELGRDGEVRRRRTRVRAIDCPVVIKGHHEPYIDWEQFERNQEKMDRNRPTSMNVGGNAPRKGAALLSGLLYCGRCGYSFSVRYASGERFRYLCRSGSKQRAGRTATCQSVSGAELDRLVVCALLEVVSAAGIEAAIEAETILLQERQQHRCVLEHSLEQARYQAERAFRQYDRVDPDNRLVANELEHRWNLALVARSEAEQRMREFDRDVSQRLCDEEREQLLALGEDLDRLWFGYDTAVETKKQIVQLLVERITVDAADPAGCQSVTVHWVGGRLTEHRLDHQRKGGTVEQAPDLVATVRTLCRIAGDQSIAQILNRGRISTTDGGTWTATRVGAFRRRHSIEGFSEERTTREGDLSAEQAAEQLRVSPMSVHRLIRCGVLPAEQAAPGLPCVLRLVDVQSTAVQQAAARVRAAAHSGNAPADDPRQLAFWPGTAEENVDD